jgi:hypothetical protein
VELTLSSGQNRRDSKGYYRLIGTTRLASTACADKIGARCFRTPLCRFLRNIFIAEFARDVGSVSPSLNSVIKQRASWERFIEGSQTLSIGSNSTNAQAFANATLKISVSAESKKPRLKSRGVMVVITVPLRYSCLP